MTKQDLSDVLGSMVLQAMSFCGGATLLFILNCKNCRFNTVNTVNDIYNTTPAFSSSTNME
jgi:hypothetical protein